MTRRLLLPLVIIAFSSLAAPALADQYDDYAAWWKKQDAAKKDWVIRDENGKRKHKMFFRPLNPPSVSAAEAEKAGMVQDPTFVLGIAIGKEARAYPLYSIGELVNDTLSEVPIAATW